MLAIEHRLRRRDEFAATVKAGRRAGRGCLVVHVLANGRVPDDAAPARDQMARVGFVVPRSVGNAVARNKVRRRLRHLMRDRLADVANGTDVVVRVSPGAAARSYQQLGADLDAAINAATVAARNSRGRKARSSA